MNRLGDSSAQFSSFWLSTSAKALQSKMRFMQQKKEKEIRLNLSTAGIGNSIIIHLLPPLCTNVVFILGKYNQPLGKFSLSSLTRVGLTIRKTRQSALSNVSQLFFCLRHPYLVLHTFGSTPSWGQSHHHFTCSFYACISQKHQKTVNSSSFLRFWDLQA